MISSRSSSGYSFVLLARLTNRQDEVFRGFSRRSPQRFHCRVVSFDIAGTLKQKVGVALPASAAQPPNIRIGPN